MVSFDGPLSAYFCELCFLTGSLSLNVVNVDPLESIQCNLYCLLDNTLSISYYYHIDSVLLPLSSILSHREVPIRLGLVCVIGLVMIDLFNVR